MSLESVLQSECTILHIVTTLEQLDTSPQKRASLDAAMAAVHIHVGLPPDPSSIAQPEVHNSRGGAGSHAPDTPAVQWFAAQGIDAAPLVRETIFIRECDAFQLVASI
eukprot:SAG11_NODE_173_length_13507_cov_10.489931_5_plen_108_part_00